LLWPLFFPWTLFHNSAERGGTAQKSLLAPIFSLVVVLVGIWLIGNTLYGSVLPNTFYVRVASLDI